MWESCLQLIPGVLGVNEGHLETSRRQEKVMRWNPREHQHVKIYRGGSDQGREESHERTFSCLVKNKTKNNILADSVRKIREIQNRKEKKTELLGVFFSM